MRVIHFSLSLGILAAVLFCDSELNYMRFRGEDLPEACTYLSLFCTTLVVYLLVSFMDPGYLPKYRSNNYDDSEDDVGITWEEKEAQAIAAVKNRAIALAVNAEQVKSHSNQENHLSTVKIKLRFCRQCLLEQPLRCRHCTDCGRCIRKFDHHCPWIVNCVGERNHSLFVIFLTLESAVVIWTGRIIFFSFKNGTNGFSWLQTNWLYLCIMIIICVIGAPLLCLWMYHIYLALTNSTTWESASRERITYLRELDMDVNPFHLGYARNCMVFCCANFPYSWDSIYTQLPNTSSSTCPMSQHCTTPSEMSTRYTTACYEMNTMEEEAFSSSTTTVLPANGKSQGGAGAGGGQRSKQISSSGECTAKTMSSTTTTMTEKRNCHPNVAMSSMEEEEEEDDPPEDDRCSIDGLLSTHSLNAKSISFKSLHHSSSVSTLGYSRMNEVSES